jgi:phage terminase large subunit
MVASALTPQQIQELAPQLAGAKLAHVRNLARQGDVLPFIAFQWPGVLLDDFQRDAIASLFDPTMKRVFLKGNTGCGKSCIAGLSVCIWFSIWPDAKAILTSSTFDHASGVLFAEVAQWYKSMRVPPGDKLWAAGIGDAADQRYVEVINPGNDEAFSGRHGEHVLFVFDEATGIPDSKWRLSKTQYTKFLAQANPRTLSGAFRQAFPIDDPDSCVTRLTPEGKSRFITISGSDCMNVRLKRLDTPLAPPGGVEAEGRRYQHGETIPPEVYQKHFRPIIPGQICYDQFLSLCSTADPRWVGVFAHGRFPSENPDTQLVLAGWLRRAYDGWGRYNQLCERIAGRPSLVRLLRRLVPVTAFGLDVAASSHGDASVLTAGANRGILRQHVTRYASTMDTVGWVIRTAKTEHGIDLTTGEVPVAVDVDGLGKGVADRLREQRVRVIECRGNDSPSDPKRFANRRAERYSDMGDRLNPEGPLGTTVFWLPEDPELGQELCAVERVYQGSDGFKFAVTPKRKAPGSSYEGPTVEGKIGRSPDKGDSATYCLEAILHAGRGNLVGWLDVLG